MYWPIGAPRVYATLPTGLPADDTPELEDNSTPTALQSPVEDHPGAKIARQESVASLESAEAHRLESSEGKTSRDYRGESGNDETAESSRTKEKTAIVDLKVARQGHLFVTITWDTVTVWQTQPTAALAAVIRSENSLQRYGPNISLLLRPDAAIIVVHTSFGYLITYSLATDPEARVYNLSVSNDRPSSRRRQKGKYQNPGGGEDTFGLFDGVSPFREVSLRFRMVIKIDAGVSAALALDDELVVTTQKPAAVQCIRWTPDSTGNQTSTELMSRMSWLPKKCHVVTMVYDRPMNLSTWITTDGKVHAVQKVQQAKNTKDKSQSLFRGYSFHEPITEHDHAVATAINARFSLIAVGTAGGSVHIYTARDYFGNIPFSHRLPPSSGSTSASIKFLSYSPDGYCLFVGLENGWMTWSVFGKPGGSSFSSDSKISEKNGECWLGGLRNGSWLGGGSEMLLVAQQDMRLWSLEFARSAVTGCFSAANIARPLLHTKTGVMIYRGYDFPDLTSISAEATFWEHVQIPSNYLTAQGPIRSAVISPDARYVAVAGRRGLMHYSVSSGRWKTFENKSMENDFVVRGGMCWYQHILIVAIEKGDQHEVRLYSRELKLNNAYILHSEPIPAPIVLLTPSGDDSILVYSHENILYHYIVTTTPDTVKLMQVGQIAFHGIVRAPARVRAMTWILPEDQLRDGDPSHDVATASVLFLVDGKLAVLQPSASQPDEQRYDMRILAQNVEYYIQMRDLPLSIISGAGHERSTAFADDLITEDSQIHTLGDSLWMFDGTDVCVWTDIQDILRSGMVEGSQTLSSHVQIPVDFYPISILLKKGIILGADSEFIQRRSISFAFYRMATRTQLFIPQILRHFLSQYDSPAALHLSHYYQDLLYFPHALEILLHIVLDEEAETAPLRESALLPIVLSFLSSFPQYLDIIVQCTRKTEVRSWRTLFAYLPPPQELFEASLQKGLLKTAGGYLLVLHTFEELSSSSDQSIRLLSRAKEEGDWELCKELARFLMSLDESGNTLRETLERVGLIEWQQS